MKDEELIEGEERYDYTNPTTHMNEIGFNNVVFLTIHNCTFTQTSTYTYAQDEILDEILDENKIGKNGGILGAENRENMWGEFPDTFGETLFLRF